LDSFEDYAYQIVSILYTLGMGGLKDLRSKIPGEIDTSCAEKDALSRIEN